MYGPLASLYPVAVDPGAEFRRAVRFLDVEAEPAVLLRAGYGLALAAGLTTGLLALLASGPLRTAGLLAAPGVTAGGAVAAEAIPKLLATARRTRSLAAAPSLVARATLSMRVAPAPERAAAFAARGGGRLADSLARHVAAARGDPVTGFDGFAAEWGRWFPDAGRALGLVAAADTVAPAERDRVLDRALNAVLEGTRTRTQAYATAIRGPATALYAFGVLLPTALVALLPAAHAAGVAVAPPVVAAVYDLAVPAVVAAAGGVLVARRPVAFPPPTVGTAHPAVPHRRWHAVLVGAGVGGVGWLLASRAGPTWAPPVLAAGWGVGAALWLWVRPVRAVHERVREAERDLGDALSLLGRRVTAGEAVETALQAVADDLDGPMGALLADGSARSRHLGLGTERALLGPGGPAERYPSHRLRAGLSAVALAASEGRPAGPALVAFADHVEDLRRVEADARAGLEEVCGTLRSTGALFGPLVAGATVALAGGVTGSGFLGGPDLAWLGPVVGVYVLLLAALLPALSVALHRGFDRALVGTAAGRALVVAPTVYVVAHLVVSGLA